MISKAEERDIESDESPPHLWTEPFESYMGYMETFSILGHICIQFYI